MVFNHFPLPSFTYIKTKPIRFIKCLLGHLLAAKTEIDNSKFDGLVRNLIFSDSTAIPSNINILYWIYPYDCTVILRDFTMPAKRG